MWCRRDRGGRHQTPIDTRTTVFYFGTLGVWRQPAAPGMWKHAQSITRTHQTHADGGMLEVKHSEEALGGFDNTTPSRSPGGFLLATVPSSTPHVFLISKTFPTALRRPGALSEWPGLGQWRGAQVTVWWRTHADQDVFFSLLSSQAQSWADLEGLQHNSSYTVELQAVTYWGQVRLKSSKASLQFSTAQNNESGEHYVRVVL